jgi:hypothetical protein
VQMALLVGGHRAIAKDLGGEAVRCPDDGLPAVTHVIAVFARSVLVVQP